MIYCYMHCFEKDENVYWFALVHHSFYANWWMLWSWNAVLWCFCLLFGKKGLANNNLIFVRLVILRESIWLKISLNLTEKNSHWQTLTLEQDRKFTPTNINVGAKPKYWWIWPKIYISSFLDSLLPFQEQSFPIWPN